MDCGEAQNLLSAWMDNELDAEGRTALEAHLADCGECRPLADGLRVQDADLRRAFSSARQAADGVAERVIAEMRATNTPRRGLPNWISLALATAAGFVAAMVLIRPSADPREEPHVVAPAPIPRPLARLALATGPVDVLPPDQPIWMGCPTSSDITIGSCVRTPAQTRCEVAATDGTQMRLNGDTEIRFANERQVELTRGQLWSAVGGSQAPLEVHASDAVVVAERAKFDIKCQDGETVLTVIEGSAQIRSGDERHTIDAGQRATIIAGRVSEQERSRDPLLATGWVNELLALKGPDNPEFADRMNDILAQIGQAKMSYMYEDEIRRLGDHCVLPLVRFLESSRSHREQTKRERAARIVADVAQPRAIPDLIVLLSDENPAVRFYSAEALKRLTGHDQGRPPDQWRADPWTASEPTHRRWQEWWQQNWRRYPGGEPPKLEPLKKI